MRLGVTLRDITAGAPHTVYAPTGGTTQPPIAGAGSPGFTAPKQDGGFFRQGGMGRALAGIVGDTLLQQSGMAPVYAPMMRQQQQAKQEEAQWQTRRQQQREDMQWEWANRPREAPAPDQFERALQASGVQPGSPEWQTAMQQRVQGILNPDPPVTLTLPNGQLYVGPRSGLATAMGGTAPAQPVGRLTPMNGGPTPPASGGFRP